MTQCVAAWTTTMVIRLRSGDMGMRWITNFNAIKGNAALQESGREGAIGGREPTHALLKRRASDACKLHIWSLHFNTWYSFLFVTYIGYIHIFWWLLGIIHKFPNFIGLTWENQKTSISMFLTFRDPNGAQMTWNFAGLIFWHTKT
jgi:hypothetical protein